MKYIMSLMLTLLFVGCAGEPEIKSVESTFAEQHVEAGSSADFNAPLEGLRVANRAAANQAAFRESSVISAGAGAAEGFPFEYQGQIIYVGMPAEPILQQLGEPIHYFQRDSCAFDDFDKTYLYSGFDLHTFTLGDNDYVYIIMFTDDSVTTPEGAYLGMYAEDMLALYGDGYEEDGGQYTYTNGQGSLTFMTENGLVKDLYYEFIVGNR